MRSSFIATTGLKLSRSPSAREQTARRWLALGVAFMALALTGVGLGVLTGPPGAVDTAPRTGPFSYFPSE